MLDFTDQIRITRTLNKFKTLGRRHFRFFKRKKILKVNGTLEYGPEVSIFHPEWEEGQCIAVD